MKKPKVSREEKMSLIQEKLETLGIPVLVERSSYESHPLGRMEWMKLYGLLMNRETEADAYFTAQS